MFPTWIVFSSKTLRPNGFDVRLKRKNTVQLLNAEYMANRMSLKWMIDLETDILGSEDRFRYLIFIKCWFGLSGRLLKAINKKLSCPFQKDGICLESQKQVNFWTNFANFTRQGSGICGSNPIVLGPRQAKSRNFIPDDLWGQT